MNGVKKVIKIQETEARENFVTTIAIKIPTIS